VSDWVVPVGRRLGGRAEVRTRAPLSGGYAGTAERVDLLVDGRVVPVVVKPADPVEVAALRAVAVVDGARAPRLLHPDPLVMGWVDGEPGAVSAAVLESLALVHRHWSRNRPRGVPVVDGAWWRALCERTGLALRGGLARTGDERYAEAAARVAKWAGDPRIHRALAVLPRTLCHGDPHRGNLLGDTLIDWGNARVAPAGLDLAVLRAQGTTELTAYRAVLPEGPHAVVEREWAWAHVHVQYLGFAADHLGPERVAEMVGEASQAVERL
jgi:hypothetical protein